MQLKVKEIPEHLKTFSLDVDSIVEKLQSKGFCDCDRIPVHEIKLALAQWFQYLVDSIDEDPEWFLEKFGLNKHFIKHLPEPFDDEGEESETDSIAF